MELELLGMVGVQNQCRIRDCLEERKKGFPQQNSEYCSFHSY